MFSDQNVLVVTICVLVGLLIWGRWRYDAVTLVALATLVLFDVIPINSAFSGFGHPAVIIVALVLLISRGLQESGFVGLIGGQLSKIPLSENQFLLVILVTAAALSS